MQGLRKALGKNVNSTFKAVEMFFKQMIFSIDFNTLNYLNMKQIILTLI